MTNTNRTATKIDTAFGPRTIVRSAYPYIQTAPTGAAPNGEWWVLNPQTGYVPVPSNARGLKHALGDHDACGNCMGKRTAIESLRSFAQTQWMAAVQGAVEDFRLSAFVHMCTAALQGEAWAVERVEYALEEIHTVLDMDGEFVGKRIADDIKLQVILDTDTTRPDGAIARSVEV